MKDPRAGELRYEIEICEGYVRCRQTGVLTSVAEAERMQKKLEAALQRDGNGLVLFDNRLTGDPNADARESMWTWCRDSPLLVRAALLLESDLSLVRANMTAVGKRSPVRSFSEETDALTWLLKRRTGTVAAQT